MTSHDTLKKQWGDALLTLCEGPGLSLTGTDMARESGAPLSVAGRLVYALRNRGLIEPGKSTYQQWLVPTWKITDIGLDAAVEFAVQQGYINQEDAA